MQFTTRQKLSLIFSVYVFLFVALVGVIFFLCLHFILLYQIQRDAARQASNIIKNHIALDNGSIIILKDRTKDSLAEEALESNVSVMILNEQLEVIKSYGLLNLYRQADRSSVKVLAGLTKDVQTSLKHYTQTVTWRDQDLYLYVAPLKKNGESFGVIVVAKSLSQVQSLEKVILLLMFFLALTSALASLFLSRFLVGKIYKPIRDLTEIISKADLEKLDKTLKVSGAKSDELVILGSKFNDMMIRLISMSNAQKEFIANASHELKTPLSRVISSLDLSISTGEKNINLEAVKEDLFEINSLLDKLMFLSRLKPGMILPSDKLSLNGIILETLQVYRRKNIIINLDRDAVIFIPKEYAKVLLSNILSNAIKYSDKDSKIEITTRLEEDKLIVNITDEGCGIGEAELHRIGERFYRGANTRGISGHGVGLSIVKRITDLYRIKFSVKTRESRGTTVSLEFILAHPA